MPIGIGVALDHRSPVHFDLANLTRRPAAENKGLIAAKCPIGVHKMEVNPVAARQPGTVESRAPFLPRRMSTPMPTE